jgi:hypothetical protein
VAKGRRSGLVAQYVERRIHTAFVDASNIAT